MPVRILPTLDGMALVYALSRQGGPSSPRFKAYVRAAKSGAPVQMFNPMAGDAATNVAAELLGIGAEGLAAEAASEALEVLGSADRVLDLYLTVGSVGMWTDRLMTEVEHRLKWATPGCIYLWADDEVSAQRVRIAAAEEVVRCVMAPAEANTESVQSVVYREGKAAVIAGSPLPELTAKQMETTRAVVDRVRDQRDLGTKVSVLYGDDAAVRGGWTPLGIPPLGGYALGRVLAISDRPG